MNRKEGSRKNARETALRALVRVEQDGAYLNLALPALLHNLSPEDRSLAVQLAAGTIRHLNTLDWSLNNFSRRSVGTFTPWIRNLLRLSAFQILYLKGIPDYAAVYEAVRLARRYGHRGVAGLVNALLRRLASGQNDLPWPDRERRPDEYLSLKHSHPQWLISRLIHRFGFQEAEKWSIASNKKPLTSVRPNSLKTTPDKLTVMLKNEGIIAFPSPVVPGMLRIKTAGISPAETHSFREGYYTIQGESSALVAPLLCPQPGDTIVDLCSAPGGKSTHLAELIKDRGCIYAVELYGHRLGLVEKAAARLGMRSIVPVTADGRTVDKQDLSEPSAVLVDAPCSGLGVIRRLPEIKWRRHEEDLPALQVLQIELLTAAARILPPGGRLIYSVCTGEPEETERVVDAFTRANRQFLPEDLPALLPEALQIDQKGSQAVTLWPHSHDLDGFYMALWRKKE